MISSLVGSFSAPIPHNFVRSDSTHWADIPTAKKASAMTEEIRIFGRDEHVFLWTTREMNKCSCTYRDYRKIRDSWGESSDSMAVPSGGAGGSMVGDPADSWSD